MTSPNPDIVTDEKADTQLEARYSVILWDSPHHTFDYVIEMMEKLLRKSQAEAMEVAVVVHTEGRASCGVFGQTEAQRKRDMIHANGSDRRIVKSVGSMYATLERVDE